MPRRPAFRYKEEVLYRACVQDVKNGRVRRPYGYLVVVMQFYPRFLSKELIDEYRRDLAPEKELFTEFKSRERATKDHNAAFDEVEYEKRFAITASGKEELERLAGISRDRDVFLICQCQALQKCHADLLLLMAKHFYNAKIPLLRMNYPTFKAESA